MNIDEIRNLTSKSANSKVENFIEEVLKLIDIAHAKGHREGVFLDKNSVLQEHEFFELDWYGMEATFHNRMKKEGIEIEEVSIDGITCWWESDSERFMSGLREDFDQKLSEWTEFFQKLIRDAAEEGRNFVYWEGEIYQNLEFREALKSVFVEAGFKTSGLSAPGKDYLGNMPEIDRGLDVFSFAEFEITW